MIEGRSPCIQRPQRPRDEYHRNSKPKQPDPRTVSRLRPRRGVPAICCNGRLSRPSLRPDARRGHQRPGSRHAPCHGPRQRRAHHGVLRRCAQHSARADRALARERPPHPIEDYIFIDVGAGKGRGLLVASEYSFRKVIGIELNAEMAAIARQNVERWTRAHSEDPTAARLAPIGSSSRTRWTSICRRRPRSSFCFTPSRRRC